MGSVNISVRMDEDIKKQADALFADLGLNLSSAITVFVKQAIREQAIPFTISRNTPNEETQAAIEEVQQLKKDPNRKTYGSFRAFMEEMGDA